MGSSRSGGYKGRGRLRSLQPHPLFGLACFSCHIFKWWSKIVLYKVVSLALMPLTDCQFRKRSCTFHDCIINFVFWWRSRVNSKFYIMPWQMLFKSSVRNTGNGILESIIGKKVIWGGMTPDPATSSGYRCSLSAPMASNIIRSTLL